MAAIVQIRDVDLSKITNAEVLNEAVVAITFTAKAPAADPKTMRSLNNGDL